jgi:NTE family protein
MKEIVLALGGGGTKGGAHIGVLRVLEREGFTIRAVSGTSAGAICASLYAFGYSPDEIQRLITTSSHAAMYARQANDGPSWMGLGGIHTLLQDALRDSRFEDLRLPCAVTAVDLNTAERLVIGRGSVLDAVMASIAVPGVFPPRNLDGRVLVDGGVMDPVPVGVARSLAPGLPVVAVVLSPPIDQWTGIHQTPNLLGSLPFLQKYISQFRFSQALNIFMRAVDIGGALLTELLLEVEKPDVLIRPAVQQIGLMDQVNLADVALLGERATEHVLHQLNQAVGWQARLRRTLRPRKTPDIHLPYAADFLDRG